MSWQEAFQEALAAEHAAVFVYGALGGQTSESGEPALYADLTEAYIAHRARRDELVAELEKADQQPVPAQAAYELPEDLSTGTAVTGRAVELERSCAATYAFVVASTTGDRRRWAIDVLIETALRELAFGGDPEPLPGL